MARLARWLAPLPIACVLACAQQPRLDITVPVPPSAVAVDGASELLYELRIDKRTAGDIALQRLTVLDPAHGKTLASFEGDALKRRLGGHASTLYVDLRVPAGAAPRALRHRLDYTIDGRAEAIDGVDIDVDTRAPVVLGAPLRGGPWAAVYSPEWERGHRRVVIVGADGVSRIPGRFAIDWVKLDASGRTAHDDEDLVVNAFGYGEDVLAVSDATVASTRDGVAEDARLSLRRKHPLEEASGNYVALDLGGDRYVFYEHLEPGSVRVKRGDTVRRGDVIAALGFTGDSTGPHLHLHVANANSPIAAEGLPFVLDRFDVAGVYNDVGTLGKRVWSDASGARSRQMERPAPNVVVDFGPRARGDR